MKLENSNIKMNKDQKQLEVLYESLNDSVYISSKKLTVLPKDWSSKDIKGNFDCHHNQLTSLDGAPDHIGGYFDCSDNRLTSLEGSPKTVGGIFRCSYNKLTSLEGAPRSVGGNFCCSSNNLTSLKGAPDHIGGEFMSDQFTDNDYREYIKYSKLREKHKELEGIF